MSRKLTWIGIAITVAYLVAAALLGWGQWDQISKMKPNEVGDFLAGVVGPLALLWLILGYFQQGEELRLSSEALRQQAMELAESVRQQTELAKVSREQLDVQKEVVERERAERRMAQLPLLSLSFKRIEGRADVPEFVFEIENLGARASQVNLTVSPNDLAIRSAKRGVLKRHEPEEISLVGREWKFNGSYQITANYRDMDGNELDTMFGLEFGPDRGAPHIRTLREQPEAIISLLRTS